MLERKLRELESRQNLVVTDDLAIVRVCFFKTQY